MKRQIGVKEKALSINLDQSIYGSFAEIGAGQEVSANFFAAGGASGTIAQTTSAYDMKISDSVYGASKKYVAEPRLVTMLDKEFNNLQSKLLHRKDETRFFAFANTVEILNYFKTNKGHGWIGLRFQLEPNQPPNECVFHVIMNDNDGLMQQKALGRVGVNLIYGVYHYKDDPEMLLNSLLDGLGQGRIEIDMFRLSGPDYEDVDNRVMSLKLVKNGMTDSAMFGPNGDVLQASQALYKKNILVLRGRFRPITHVNLDMLKMGLKEFRKEEDVDVDRIQVLFELTLKDLSAEGRIDEQDFLDRVDIIGSLGYTVLISNYQKYYTLVSYLSDSVRNRKVGVILGVDNLKMIFDDSYYDRLKGRLLEAYGILFGRNVKLYVYPALKEDDKTLKTLDDLDLNDGSLYHLLEYLKAKGKIETIRCSNQDILHIYSDHVVRKIKDHEQGWEYMVPSIVAQMIKDGELFGWKNQVLTSGEES
ncbi:MAG: TonB-dependent receptor [Salibacteraceae bacterium]